MDYGANPVERSPFSKALQNALIMDEISKYITLVDMMNCRSANNLWKTEWTPAIQKRSKSWLCVTDNMDMLVKDLRICHKQSPNSDWDRAHWNFIVMNDSKIGTKSSELIQWINKNLHSFPCSKFRISTKAFKLVDQSVLDTFFCAMLNIATELHLESSSNGPPFRCNPLETLNLVFHNLAILKIEFMFVSKQQRERHIALKIYQNIIKLAPNLNTLSLINCCAGQNDCGLITGCISAISNPDRIETLHIRDTITDNLIEKLIVKKLHLTHFELFFETFSNVSSESFESFLNAQQNSLRRLYLKSKVLVPRTLPIIFPQMDKLELLEIETYDGLTFPGLNLQQSFSRLKHFKVRGIAATVFTGLQPVETLEEFDLGRSYANQNNILQICRIFPNLKRLSVPCKQCTMIALNTAIMNHLEKLTLFGESEEMMRNMIEALTGVMEDDQGRILMVMRRGPLAFLHKIKILRLVNGFLTDTHCMLGLMDLQSLQCLDLRMNYPNKKHKISESMLEQLRGKFTVLL